MSMKPEDVYIYEIAKRIEQIRNCIVEVKEISLRHGLDYDYIIKAIDKTYTIDSIFKEFEPIDTMTETTLKKGLKYFKRAIELGYMTRQPDGLLKWNESKAKLAYFISRIYIKQVPFKYICNVVYSKCPGDCNRLDAALYQLKKTHEISWKSEIDNIINSAY